jgi:hypothetical protein
MVSFDYWLNDPPGYIPSLERFMVGFFLRWIEISGWSTDESKDGFRNNARPLERDGVSG